MEIHTIMKTQENNEKDIIKGVGGSSKSSTRDIKEFRALIDNVLPDLYPYLVRRLNMAHATGALEKSDSNAGGILDAVYRRLMECFDLKPEHLRKLQTWCYRIADEVLEETLEEESFYKQRAMDLDLLEQMELSDLEEVFTIDAEGELIMIEDLDDISYHPAKSYDTLAILQDHSTIYEVEQALLRYDRDLLQMEIRRLLLQLPEVERTVFDLFWLEGMDIEQIAAIRDVSKQEITEMLKEVTLQVKHRLESKLKSGADS